MDSVANLETRNSTELEFVDDEKQWLLQDSVTVLSMAVFVIVATWLWNRPQTAITNVKTVELRRIHKRAQVGRQKRTVQLPSFLSKTTEVQPPFLLTSKGEIYFSSTISGQPQIYRYREGKVELSLNSSKSLAVPFLMNNKVIAVTDEVANEKYFTSKHLNQSIKNQPMRYVRSSKSGKWLLIQMARTRAVYVLNLQTSQFSRLPGKIFKIYGVAFTDTMVFVSAGMRLFSYHLYKKEVKEIASHLKGLKRQPSINENWLYFSCNADGEYYKIYRFPILQPQEVSLVHYGKYDYLSPKRIGDYLYYIQLKHSQYLLHRRNMKTGVIEKLTRGGVVYQYEFWKPGVIVLLYSTLRVPRNIALLQLKTKNIQWITGKAFQASVSYVIHFRKKSRSEAHLFFPKLDKVPKGVVLYFHPGLHSDFSPRWDDLLMSLVAKGYVVIGPNYPMSSGYGKNYYHATMEDAVRDMQQWKRYISRRWPKTPLFFYSASSGNYLMERLLTIDSKKVAAAASLCGFGTNRHLPHHLPTLYFLGKKDPMIHYQRRKAQLWKAKKHGAKITIFSFNEGHWLRKKSNHQKVIHQLLQFFAAHQK